MQKSGRMVHQPSTHTELFQTPRGCGSNSSIGLKVPVDAAWPGAREVPFPPPSLPRKPQQPQQRRCPPHGEQLLYTTGLAPGCCVVVDSVVLLRSSGRTSQEARQRYGLSLEVVEPLNPVASCRICRVHKQESKPQLQSWLNHQWQRQTGPTTDASPELTAIVPACALWPSHDMGLRIQIRQPSDANTMCSRRAVENFNNKQLLLLLLSSCTETHKDGLPLLSRTKFVQ